MTISQGLYSLLTHAFKGIFEVETKEEMKSMKAKVTKRGLVIPIEMLAGAEEVEIRKEDHRIVISPLTCDLILNPGKRPVECGVSDASEHHDSYLYGSGS
jgi:hypothetical protein